MGKKDKYYQMVQKLYVEEQKSVIDISRAVDLSERTLHKWKKEGSWENKRADFVNMKTSCNSALYELTNAIVLKTLEAYKNSGELPDKSSMDFIKAMADKLPKFKNFEAIIVDEQKETMPKDIDKELLNKVDKILMDS